MSSPASRALLPLLLAIACAREPVPVDPAAPLAVLGAERLEDGLHARHGADVPTLAQVRQVQGGFPTLQGIVEQADLLAVKARGITAMGAFVPGEAEPWLQALLADPDTHPKLRAAALRALGEAGGPLSEPLRAAQRTAVHDADPRVALAAIDGIATTAPGRAFLQELDLSVDAQLLVREHLASVKARNEAD